MPKKCIWIIVLAASLLINQPAYPYLVNTHRAISAVAVSRPESDIHRFLIQELLMPEGLNTIAPDLETSNSMSLLNWIQEGSDREDDYTIPPLGRFFNHFFNPVTGLGLNDFISGSGSFQQTDSLSWAWGSAEVQNEWGWLQARELYFAMLGTPWEENTDVGTGILLPGRRTLTGRTFRALGHIIHLVQDLGQPQHTRNDAHSPFEGAPYEDFCSIRYGSPEQLSALPYEPLPQFTKRYPSRVSLVNSEIPEEISNLWTTQQYRGSGSIQYYRGSLGLAEYSNAFFVTDDTLFTGQNSMLAPGLTVTVLGNVASQHVFMHPRLESTDIAFKFSGNLRLIREGERNRLLPTVPLNSIQGENIRNLVSVQPFPAPGVQSADLLLTNENWQAYANKLLPKTISYSSALLKYFFRGKLSVSSNGIVEVILNPNDPSTKLQYHELLVTNISDEEISGGDWHLFADNVPGVPLPFSRINYSCHITPLTLPILNVILNPNGYKGRLGINGSFTIWVPPIESRTENGEVLRLYPWSIKPSLLVFKGTLGNEKDTAVMAKRFAF